ncbi:hypothetical protein QCA50_000983 [Cerrena zonata]|uniref:Uncharacterized protein n=1 Tax=Cerrena zonata TaxID=2478898 RepID=A0AAW0GVZ2_9APHY
MPSLPQQGCPSKRTKTSSVTSDVDTDSDRESSPEVQEVLQADHEASQSAGPQSLLAKFKERYQTHTKTPQAVLEEQQSKWKSNVYNHFHPPVIVTQNGVVKYKFVCKVASSSVILRACHDEATSNLKHHTRHCEGKIAPAGQAINDYAHGSTYSKASFRYLLALWVSRHHCPFVIVQDEELLRIFRMLYSRVEVPHPTTVSRNVKYIFSRARLELGKILQVGLTFFGISVMYTGS